MILCRFSKTQLIFNETFLNAGENEDHTLQHVWLGVAGTVINTNDDPTILTEYQKRIFLTQILCIKITYIEL